MKNDHPVKGASGKAGFCDAIMGREARQEFTGHYDKLNYQAGYAYGKESGVVFPFTEKQSIEGKGGKGWQR